MSSRETDALHDVFLSVRLLETPPCCAYVSLSLQWRVALTPGEGWAPPHARGGEAGAPCSSECICWLFSTLYLLSILWGPFYTSLPRFSQMAALQPRCCLFIRHFKSSNAEKGIEWDKCLLHPRRTKGTCQFPACAFSRLRRLSQSCAPLLKASSHSFTTRRLLFSEKLGFRVVISKEVLALCGSTGAICMLHLGNFPLLMVGLTAAPWQPVVEIH